MIIKEFAATDVFGYLNFNICFNRDKNFLVGVNGSGKTTALKLMNALVTPNFRDLITIPFNRCSLLLEVEGEDINICASREDDSIFLYYVDKSGREKVELPALPDTELNLFSRREDTLEELVKDLIREYASHTVIENISKIPSPVFLGLDRRTDFLESKNDYFLEREILLSNRKKEVIRARRRFEGTTGGVSLIEIEMLVKSVYKHIRELEIHQSQKLRDQILISSFKYINLDKEMSFGKSLKIKELFKRKNEVKKAILNTIGLGSSIDDEVESFFKSLNDLYKDISTSESYANIELLLNMAQIERMYNIVEIIDEYKSKNDEYYKPINDFLTTVNSFYQDSGKKLEVDTVGQLVVKRPDGKACTIEGLSSGERQLLIIFTHSYFNQNNIFIIDEPEISLHLGWQEKLVDAIFLSNPKSQFILATHSPEIVVGNEDKAVGCR